MSHLSTVGILIHYYRKKANIKTNDFIIDIDNNEICSSKTLRSIEKGTVHKIDYFDMLCRKINKKFYVDSKLNEKLDQLNDSIILALEKMSVVDLKNIYNQLMNLKVNKQSIYYYECVLLYRDIINYHLFNIIPDKENIEIFKTLLKVDNSKLYKLILSFLYSISNINTMNIDKKEIMEKCIEYLDDPLFFVQYLVNIYNNNSIFNSYQIYKNMLDDKELNLYQKTYLNYMMALCLLNGDDSKSAYALLNDVLDNTPKNYFPSEFEVRINCCMGICAHSIKKYDVSAEYFGRAYISNFSKINYNYLLYFNSLQNINKSQDIIRLCNEINLNKLQNKLVHSIINYYKIKFQNISEEIKYPILEGILINELIRLIDFGNEYLNILANELLYICSFTGNYENFKYLYKQ